MKSNYIIAFVLSFAVLLGWDYFVVRPRKQAARAAEAVAAAPAPAVPSTSPAAAVGSAVPAPVKKENLVVYEIGENRLSVNRWGGAVAQWEILENGRWLTLVPRADLPQQGLATFPDLEFDVQRDGHSLTFTAARADGLRVEKTLTLSDNHRHALSVKLRNAGKAAIDADVALGWGPGVEGGDEAGAKAGASKGTQRAIVAEGDAVRRVKEGTVTGDLRWWAVDGHYFLAAFVPGAPGATTLRVSEFDDYFAVTRAARDTLRPGDTQETAFTFYLGPKILADLKATGLGLEKSVNFGFFAPLAQLIHTTLLTFHKATKNFGWSIILLTFIIQAIVLPLTVSSFKHGQKMKAVQPQMKRLQELYKNDARRLNVEMMDLYKRHGLRFMGLEGCLPVFIQMPVFFALYNALRSTYELRHAPWIGWIKDLSLHDPFYALPVLMGAGMFFQQKMSMASMDPSQRQIMYIMPVMFTFFFLKMPSGLVLYWLTSSLLGIAVQLILTKRHAAAAARP